MQDRSAFYQASIEGEKGGRINLANPPVTDSEGQWYQDGYVNLRITEDSGDGKGQEVRLSRGEVRALVNALTMYLTDEERRP